MPAQLTHIFIKTSYTCHSRMLLAGMTKRGKKIKSKSEANKTHHEVGARVRQTIKELGGTMPEELPAPEKSAFVGAHRAVCAKP
ncbi:MAG: hypothetical protein D8M57_04485 [Candidatus Scalindua sp. AMX11]|nr:MAG: hypothetical protein DWQ00_04110 [Candidatus Scalindua sp.]TDE66074.1 MAG: hypothetical protein D8M57_04485 [Candidatus Scalindua sp. AMX11]GJQ59046.1 MAG: hypothetical protein SCALA701_18470 [Candidatus Scalindua sp.]